MAHLIQQFIAESARRAPQAAALRYRGAERRYGALARAVEAAAGAFLALGIGRRGRIAVYLEKRAEAVVAMFGAAAAGAVFVPVNPLLKPEQVAHILADCGVAILVTSQERLLQLAGALAACPALAVVLLVNQPQASRRRDEAAPALPGLRLLGWDDCLAEVATQPHTPHDTIDTDMAAILYTSGSTGKPKGVVLSHRNLVAGAVSVAGYLDNRADDRILALLPLSFDYGLSQLTTAFASGACVVLMNHLLLRDIVDTVDEEEITGLAAVPPLWIQLAQLPWPQAASLRYLTNSGGAMPRATVDKLRRQLPGTRVFLMYGLTEAFRSTYLEPEQLERRPGSIGKAIPNAEVMVLRPDGSRCAVDEPGELVHRGALVALGYWNDIGRTAERFRPLPAQSDGLPLAELAVWSGDTVRTDADGYLYFVGRSDEMIKSSGYRISPTEVEEVAYASGLVGEAAALGIAHPVLGQAVLLLATAAEGGAPDAAGFTETLMAACKLALPGFMVPARIELRSDPLPRNANGKIDRKLLAQELAGRFDGSGL